MDVLFIGKLARTRVALAAMGLCSPVAPAAPGLAACELIGHRDVDSHGEPENIAKAAQEVGYFYGHLMLPAELDRAKEIRQTFPSLATRIDVLVAGQAEIREEDEREKREFRVENETWQRDENEKRAKQRRDPKAPSPAERLQTESSLIPDVCKTVEAGHTSLYGSPWTEKIAQATALREGGNVRAACEIYGEIRQHNETVSKAYDACNKQIKGIYTVFARQGMFDFFVLAQKIRMQVLEGAHCP